MSEKGNLSTFLHVPVLVISCRVDWSLSMLDFSVAASLNKNWLGRWWAMWKSWETRRRADVWVVLIWGTWFPWPSTLCMIRRSNWIHLQCTNFCISLTWILSHIARLGTSYRSLLIIRSLACISRSLRVKEFHSFLGYHFLRTLDMWRLIQSRCIAWSIILNSCLLQPMQWFN